MKIIMLHNGYKSLGVTVECGDYILVKSLSVVKETFAQDAIDLGGEIAAISREAWEAGKRGEPFELEQILVDLLTYPSSYSDIEATRQFGGF